MKILFLSILVAVFSASQLFGGVVYEIEVKDHEQSPPKTESIEMAAEGRHLKMGIGSGSRSEPRDRNQYSAGGRTGAQYGPRGGGSGGTMYYDDEKKVVVMVDGNEGFSIDSNSFNNSPMGQPPSTTGGGAPPPGVPPAVWNMLPPDKKAEIMKAMGNAPGGPPAGGSFGQPAKEEEKFVDTGKSGKTADGKRYRLWRRYVNGQLKNEFKVVDWRDVPEGPNLESLFAGFTAFMDDMQKSASGGSGFSSPTGNMFDGIAQINGFPWEGTEFENNRKVGEFRVTKMTKKNLSQKDMQPDPNIPIKDMGKMMQEAAAGMGDLFNQMGQGNPNAGSSIDREALERMRQSRQNNQNRRGPVTGTSSGAAEDARNN